MFLGKTYFENMLQIYRRKPMPKWDFNKVAMQLDWNRTLVWVFSYKFAAYFQNIFSQRYTNADLKICQYFCLRMKIICRRFHFKTHFTF